MKIYFGAYVILPAQHGAGMDFLDSGQWGLSAEKNLEIWEISYRNIPRLDQLPGYRSGVGHIPGEKEGMIPMCNQENSVSIFMQMALCYLHLYGRLRIEPGEKAWQWV